MDYKKVHGYITYITLPPTSPPGPRGSSSTDLPPTTPRAPRSALGNASSTPTGACNEATGNTPPSQGGNVSNPPRLASAASSGTANIAGSPGNLVNRGVPSYLLLKGAKYLSAGLPTPEHFPAAETPPHRQNSAQPTGRPPNKGPRDAQQTNKSARAFSARGRQGPGSEKHHAGLSSSRATTTARRPRAAKNPNKTLSP